MSQATASLAPPPPHTLRHFQPAWQLLPLGPYHKTQFTLPRWEPATTPCQATPDLTDQTLMTWHKLHNRGYQWECMSLLAPQPAPPPASPQLHSMLHLATGRYEWKVGLEPPGPLPHLLCRLFTPLGHEFRKLGSLLPAGRY